MTTKTTPVLVDRTPLAGIFPMTRRWYDCGNGYGVSTVVSPGPGAVAVQVAAGLWMDRTVPRWWRFTPARLHRPITLMHDTGERVHVATDAEALALVDVVAGLPPLGSELPPRRLLPPCRFGWCVRNEMPCTAR